MKFNKISLIIFLGFLSRLVISIWNGFFGPSYGAEQDAQTFHYNAVDIATSSVQFDFNIGDIYEWWLALWYYVFTPNLFLGSLLSVFSWLASALLLNKILSLLNIKNNQKEIIFLIYSLWPASVMLTAVTLREAYQLYFITLSFYAALKIYITNKNIYWLLLLIGFIGAGVLHGGLLAYGLFFVCFTMVYMQTSKTKAGSVLKIMMLIPLLGPVIYFGGFLFSTESYDLSGGVAQSIESYQIGGMSVEAQGRSDYRTAINIGGFYDLLFFFPVALFQYLFEPMPWKISNIPDAIVFIENIIRAYIFVVVFKAYKSATAMDRKLLFFTIISYLVLESIWAIGTKNWGTAIRHHIPSLAILLFAYAISMKIASNKTAK